MTKKAIHIIFRANLTASFRYYLTKGLKILLMV
jgi:hypothetical protein